MRLVNYLAYYAFLLPYAWHVGAMELSDLPKCVKKCLDREIAKLDCSGDKTECLCANVLYANGFNDCSTSSCASNEDVVGGLQRLMGHCYLVRRQAESSVEIVASSAESAASSLAPAPAPATQTAAEPQSSAAASSAVASVLPSSVVSADSASSLTSAAPDTTSATVYTVIFSTGTATYPTDGSLLTTTYTYTSSVTDPRVFASLLLASATSASSTPTSTGAANSEGGLSTGAKVGIGIGVTLGILSVLAIAGGALYVRRKRAAKAQQSVDASNGNSDALGGKAELQNQGLFGHKSHGHNEIGGVEKKYANEMDATDKATAAELEAEYYAEMSSKEEKVGGAMTNTSEVSASPRRT